ncbi:MAG: TIGR02466 family protein [Proteobacteria bacterium]|nr:TIGR02466 family protein [Pseudomonadota bacterium]
MAPLGLDLFSTPVVIVDLPGMAEVNAALAARLLAEATDVPSWQRSNVGGWHSPPDLAARADPAVQTLLRAIVDETTHLLAALAGEAGVTEVPRFRYALTAWAMVMREGDYVAPHDHGDVHWSAVYYVDASEGASAPAGRLTLLDPRRSSGRDIPGLELFPPTFEVTPRTGVLVLFPGWLQHYVHAHRGARPRISIACNITLHAT